MADATIAPTAAGGLTPLEAAKPLRESLLWKLQASFYVSKGLSAWSDAIVPNFVTSNTFIASNYAKVILGFMRDWFLRHPAADPTQPMYIVEVGSGHGKLAFLLARELLAAREQWPQPDAAQPPFVIVVTDFTSASLPFWADHPRLKPLIQAGVLDLACFDAERDRELRLFHSGKTLSPGSLRNPVVGVANYVFDTLRQDAFRLVEGQLQEATVALYTEGQSTSSSGSGAGGEGGGEPPAAAQPPSSSVDPEAIKRLRCVWDYRLCAPEIYRNPHLQTMLRAYTSRMRNASLLVPIGGITCLANLAALSGGRLLMLAGDKAYNHEEELSGLRDPHVAVHGSFSLMVNFHAVRLYTLARGGFSLHTPYLDGFKVSAFVLGVAPPPTGGAGAASSSGGSAGAAAGAAGGGVVPSATASLPLADVVAAADVTLAPSALASCPDLLYAWADAMDTFGPDNFSTLQRCVKDETPAPSLKLALSVLRMSSWDADVFFKFKQTLIDRCTGASDKQQADLLRDVYEVAARYFPLQPSKDISFELGRICMGLQRYPQAIVFFDASQRQCGEHHVSYYNLGICNWYIGELTAAHAAFSRSVAMRPDYSDAASWKTRCEARLAGNKFSTTAAASDAAPPGAEGSASVPSGSAEGAGAVSATPVAVVVPSQA